MTTPAEPNDEQWLRMLTGSAEPEASSTMRDQVAAIRKALQARRDALDLTVPAADDVLYKQVQKRLEHEQLRRRVQTSWKRTLAFALAAFILGLAVARLAMLSSAPAMRSMGPSSPSSTPYAEAFREYLTQQRMASEEAARWAVRRSTRTESSAGDQIPFVLRVPDPLATVQTASREAVALGLSFSVAKDGEAYRLYVEGLLPGAPAQQKLRDALSLESFPQQRSVFLSIQKKQ